MNTLIILIIIVIIYLIFIQKTESYYGSCRDCDPQPHYTTKDLVRVNPFLPPYAGLGCQEKFTVEPNNMDMSCTGNFISGPGNGGVNLMVSEKYLHSEPDHESFVS